MFKQCKKCLELKSVDEFHNDKNRKDGKYIHCKKCHYEYMRDRYHNKPGVRETALIKYKKISKNQDYKEKNKQRGERFYYSLEGRIKTFLNSMKRYDPETDVTANELREMLNIGTCPVTGYKFNFEKPKLNRFNNPFAPSIDKIDPDKGYRKGNVRIVIWQYNLMKGELTDFEIACIAHAVLRNAKWI